MQFSDFTKPKLTMSQHYQKLAGWPNKELYILSKLRISWIFFSLSCQKYAKNQVLSKKMEKYIGNGKRTTYLLTLTCLSTSFENLFPVSFPRWCRFQRISGTISDLYDISFADVCWSLSKKYFVTRMNVSKKIIKAYTSLLTSIGVFDINE